jgi:integrating conjugative element protein (TIGR03765 family)
MRSGRQLVSFLCGCVLALPVYAARHRLIVVEDLGGASALPYYRALNLLPLPNDAHPLPLPPPVSMPSARYSEADFLPVRSKRLTPGLVKRRVIAAPGLTPIFLIGDDLRSRAWLKDRLSTLQTLHAVGLVVQIPSYGELKALRRIAPGVPLMPASGDDLARRLDLRHYPVLITATGIEQ